MFQNSLGKNHSAGLYIVVIFCVSKNLRPDPFVLARLGAPECSQLAASQLSWHARSDNLKQLQLARLTCHRLSKMEALAGTWLASTVDARSREGGPSQRRSCRCAPTLSHGLSELRTASGYRWGASWTSLCRLMRASSGCHRSPARLQRKAWDRTRQGKSRYVLARWPSIWRSRRVWLEVSRAVADWSLAGERLGSRSASQTKSGKRNLAKAICITTGL